MTKENRKIFWVTNLVFYIVATAFLYNEGVFNNIDFGGIIILLFTYLLCSFFIFKYFKGLRQP